MPLKIELKPGERLIIGQALITNDKDRTRFYIEGDVPILREKFVMTLEDIDTPCKRLYYIVQNIYLNQNLKDRLQEFFDVAKEITLAAPSLTPFLDAVSQSILNNNYYNALKDAMTLINKEKSILNRLKQD